MMKKLLLFLFLSVLGVLLHSCSTAGCGEEVVVSCSRLSDDGKSIPQNQFVHSNPVGDLLYSGSDSHTRVSNIYQRTLQQLFQQWNREVIKSYTQYLQRAQAVSLLCSCVTYYIGSGVDVSLYVYRIRHIII